MFTPIKNLITYIQKNASGSTFFGGTSSNAELSDESVMETNFSAIAPPLIEMATMNEKNHDQNENEIYEDCTVVSSIIDDPLMIKEDDAAKDIFLDFPSAGEQDEQCNEEFPASEVIVLDNPDLNNSITSEPGSDPLAIDPFGSQTPDSPSALNTSVDSNVLFMVDIDEIEGKAPLLNDDTESEEASTTLAAGKATDEQEIRSDGSDSGLGSETSALQTTATSVTDTSICSTASCSPRVTEKVPMRSNLKRPYEPVDGSIQLQKKLKRTINFDGVKVFYFPRIQGHGCVPSQGGCTLGMGAHHISFKTFTLSEHAAELRRAHKLQLQEINPRGSSSEESDSDEELSEGSGSDLDAETNGFLQPVSPKQRRALLKAAGVRKIDPSEKIECRNIRNSREVCGCMCRDFCDPDTCTCSQAGIKCQVDRAMFPCGCSHDACGNVIGRIEFSPGRVRTHFFHTMMRMEMENRQQKRPDGMVPQLTPPATLAAYSTVPPITNTTAVMNSYNTIPSYGLEQSQTAVGHVFHHHMHQQHNAYMSHMPPTHPASSVYANLSNPMGIETTTAPLPLPQPHSHYLNATSVTEPESISSSLAINGGSLHYPDGSIYPPVSPAPLPPPPAAVYADILAPYATSISYHSPHVESNYTAGVYASYHNPHHVRNHPQHEQSEQFLGYATSCSGELNDYNESQSSFICLNAPEACSSRLSAINDLLHNNRNTTAALVAISDVSTEEISTGSSQHEPAAYPAGVNDECAENDEADETPIIEDCQKVDVKNQHPDTTNPLETNEPPLALVQSETGDVPLSESKQCEPSPSIPIISNDVSPPDSKELNLSTPVISTSDNIIEDDRPATVAAENDKEPINADKLPPIVETVSA